MNNETIRCSLSDVFADYLRLLKERTEGILEKSISTLFLVVPQITPFVSSFFESIATRIATPIELISSSTAMCLSYGFFDDDVRKTFLAMDFGWDAVRLQVVRNENNRYRMGARGILPFLCGKSLSREMVATIENQIVLLLAFCDVAGGGAIRRPQQRGVPKQAEYERDESSEQEQVAVGADEAAAASSRQRSRTESLRQSDVFGAHRAEAARSVRRGPFVLLLRQPAYGRVL